MIASMRAVGTVSHVSPGTHGDVRAPYRGRYSRKTNTWIPATFFFLSRFLDNRER